MRRLAALLLALLCLTSGAGAEGATFRMQIQLDPMQVSQENRTQAQGIQALLRQLEMSGTLAFSENSFDLTIQAAMVDVPETATTLHIYGLDSHWGIEGDWLGDTTLMVNQLAWLEFAVKAYHHLDWPLQRVFLWVSPYAHTSAWVGIAAALEKLAMSEQDGVISAENLRNCAEELARLSEEDRALYYYVEAIGLESGVNEEIRSLLQSLPALVAQHFPDGLTVEHTEYGDIWRSGEMVVYERQTTESEKTLTVALPEVLHLSVVLNADSVAAVGSATIDMAYLTANVQFSLPTAWPVRFPFFAQLDAQGELVGDGIQLLLRGEAQGEQLTMVLLSGDRQFLTLTADITPDTAISTPCYTPEEIVGVNILSVDGPELSALMGEIAQPLLTGLFPWLVHAPAQTVQVMMDALEDTGVLDLLTDALLGAETEGY